MITALVYLINGIVMAFFSVKVYRSLKQKFNPYLLYFLGTTAFYCLSLFAYFFLVLAYLIQHEPHLLFWSDYLGRFFLYAGSAIAIQIPLYKFFPKSKLRYLATLFLSIIGISLAVYNFYHQNQPYLDASGAVHWEADAILAGGLAFMFLSVWIPTTIVFGIEFIKSKFKSLKSFLLSTGFLISAICGSFQDYSRTPFQYIVVNLLMAVGFILIFIGLFHEE